MQAYEPSEDLLDYAATKAAILNFSKGLARQLAPVYVLLASSEASYITGQVFGAVGGGGGP